jgi:hypothetical protein
MSSAQRWLADLIDGLDNRYAQAQALDFARQVKMTPVCQAVGPRRENDLVEVLTIDSVLDRGQGPCESRVSATSRTAVSLIEGLTVALLL